MRLSWGSGGNFKGSFSCDISELIMKKILLKAAISLGTLLGSSMVNASDNYVGQVTHVEGKALLEKADGSRHLVKTGDKLLDGESLMVLEKSSLTLHYPAKNCDVSYIAGTFTTVAESAACAKPIQLAVGQVANSEAINFPPLLPTSTVGSLSA